MIQYLIRCEELSLCMPRPLSNMHVANVVSKCNRLLLCVDYDGTLAPIVNDPIEARPSQELMTLLDKLSHHPRIEMVIVSGRDRDTLEQWLGNLDIGLCAEHGAAFKWHEDGTCDMRLFTYRWMETDVEYP